MLRSCMEYLALCGIAAWRINTAGTPLHDGSGGFRPAPAKGIADIVALVRMDGCPWGRGAAIETKSATGRQSPAQSEFQAKWEKAGGLYLLVRSAQELKEKLTDAGVLVR